MTTQSEVTTAFSFFLHAKEAEMEKAKHEGRRYYLRQERLKGEIA